MEQQRILKVVLIGDTRSGKTTFINRSIYRRFESKFTPTLGVEVESFRYRNSILNIWDTAGDDRYVGLKDGYYLKADVFLVFCNSETYRNIQNWIDLARRTSRNARFVIIYNRRGLNDLLPIEDHEDHEYQINLKNDRNMNAILNAILM